MNINTFLLRFIARSSDSLVAFVVALDAKLDAFIEQYNEDILNMEDEITDIRNDVESRILDIKLEADDHIDAVRAEQARRKNAVDILGKLKVQPVS